MRVCRHRPSGTSDGANSPRWTHLALAWDRFANEKLPPDVEFFHGSDEQFVAQWEDAKPQPEKFNLVVLNYAVNHDKAVRFAKTLVVRAAIS